MQLNTNGYGVALTSTLVALAMVLMPPSSPVRKLEAHRIISGRQCSDVEIEAALTAIPGISPWTVHGFLIIALDHPAVVLAGDLTVRRTVK
jgi:hypothetical protein